MERAPRALLFSSPCSSTWALCDTTRKNEMKVGAWCALVLAAGCFHRGAQPDASTSGCHPPPRVVRASVVGVTAESGVIGGVVYDAWSLKPLPESVVLLVGAPLVGTHTN